MKLAFLLALAVLSVVALAQDCPYSYCANSSFHTDCSYSPPTGCTCTINYACDYGCSLDRTSCASSTGGIGCPEHYCEGVTYYSGCYYTGVVGGTSCNCPTRYGCPYGCNLNKTACAEQNTTDTRCPNQCYEGILHYNGRYIESMQSCISESLNCPTGICLPDHSACAPATTPTPTPSPRCSDGTLLGTCAANKPYYCDAGVLRPRCMDCGCPAGLTCNATFALGADTVCVQPTPTPTPIPTPQTCSDGTSLYSCSTNKPYYCDGNGVLQSKCMNCGCPSGLVCDVSFAGGPSQNAICVQPTPTPTPEPTQAPASTPACPVTGPAFMLAALLLVAVKK